MSLAIVGKWGKSLAVRFPVELARGLGLDDGEAVEIEPQDGAILIRRIPRQAPLQRLFQGHSREEWRRAYAEAYEWGPERGRESVPE